jgi:hypothetical protein
MKHTKAKQVKPGPAIPKTFNQFELMDLPLNLALAPGERENRIDGT